MERLDQIVELNLANVEDARSIYAPYLHLLREEARIKAFTAELNHTREHYLEQVFMRHLQIVSQV